MGNRSSQRVEKLHEAFARAGVTVEVPPDIQVSLWMKFLFITSFSGLGSMTRAPVGVWRKLPETHQMAEQALQEIKTLAEARGVSLPEDAIPMIMDMFDSLPPGTTTSMQRDLMEGRPSELDALIGVVVRFSMQTW